LIRPHNKETNTWEGNDILVKGNKVIINRGNREGVTVGRQFKVGNVKELVGPDTGEVLDSKMTHAGTIKVTKVKEKIAYCAPVSGGKAMRKGISVFIME